MKKFLFGLLLGMLIVAAPALAQQSAIKLIVNGKEVPCDPPPQIINDRVFVPVRFVAEALGANVNWDHENNAVIIKTSMNANNVSYNPTNKKEDSSMWISLNDLCNTYNVFASVGDIVTLKNGNIEITFPHPTKEHPKRLTESLLTVQTNLGELKMKVLQGRFFFYLDDLKQLGLIS